jgi:hypothetical protein
MVFVIVHDILCLDIKLSVANVSCLLFSAVDRNLALCLCCTNFSSAMSSLKSLESRMSKMRRRISKDLSTKENYFSWDQGMSVRIWEYHSIDILKVYILRERKREREREKQWEYFCLSTVKIDLLSLRVVIKTSIQASICAQIWTYIVLL